MVTWFLVKVRVTRPQQDGHVKKITEEYLFDAVSYTEAEAQANRVFQEILPSEYLISKISKTNITDVFDDELGADQGNDRYYKVQIAYELESDGKPKEVKNVLLLNAISTKQVVERTFKSMDNMLVEFRITEIKETKILETYPHHTAQEQDVKFTVQVKHPEQANA